MLHNNVLYFFRVFNSQHTVGPLKSIELSGTYVSVPWVKYVVLASQFFNTQPIFFLLKYLNVRIYSSRCPDRYLSFPFQVMGRIIGIALTKHFGWKADLRNPGIEVLSINSLGTAFLRG